MTAAVPPGCTAEEPRAERLRQLALLSMGRVANARPRFGGSVVAALVAANALASLWPLFWCAGLAVVVLIDRALFQRVAARCAAGVEPRMAPIIAWTIWQSVYGNLLSLWLWFAPLPQGVTLAVIMFSGGMANSAVSMRASRPLLLASAGPTMALLLGLPLLEYFMHGMAEPFELLPMVGGLVLIGYGVQLWRSLVESDAVRLQGEAAVLRERQAAAAAAAARSETLKQVNDALRTPLAALAGAIEHLRRTAATPNARQQIGQLAQASELAQLALSDVGALERGEIPIRTTPTDARELLRGVVNAFRPAAQDKQLELFADVAPSMPALLDLDPLRVRQVLCNLLANAVRNTTHGGVRVRMCAEPVDRPGCIRLAFYVADTGAGMSRSQLALAFSRTEPGGKGAGLAIARKVALAMGGRLTAKSDLGEGSIVCFALETQVASARSAESATTYG